MASIGESLTLVAERVVRPLPGSRGAGGGVDLAAKPALGPACGLVDRSRSTSPTRRMSTSPGGRPGMPAWRGAQEP